MTAAPLSPWRVYWQGGATVMLSLALSLPASAGMPVSDLGNMLQNIISAIQSTVSVGNDVIEHTATAARWKQQLAQYQQQLIKVQAQLRSVDLPAMHTLAPVDPQYLVSESCGRADLGFQQLLQPVTVSSDAQLREQLQQICVNIRVVRNRKYNDSVAYLTRSVPQMKQALTDIFAVRSRNNEQGTVQAADSEALRTANDLQVAGLEWEGRMLAYDAYLAAMEDHRRILATQALKGSPARRSARSVATLGALALALKE